MWSFGSETGFLSARTIASPDSATVSQSLNQLVAVRRKDEKTHSGVWRDLAVRHRRTEVDAHFVPILAHASDLAIAVPVLTRMIHMIHEVEDGTRDLSRSNLEELASHLHPPEN